MTIEYGWASLLVMYLVLVVGSSIQGAVGYGMALIATPIIVMVDPYLIPGPLTVAASVLIVLVALRDQQAVDFYGLRFALMGMIPGVLIASLLLARMDTATLVTVFGVLVLAAVLMSVIGLRIKPKPSVLLGAGFTSGVMGILATLSGPPIALVYQHADGPRLRATMSGYFIATVIVSIVSLMLVGRFGWVEIQHGLLLTPPILIGFLLSGRIARIVDRGYTRPVILGLSALAALVIIGKQIAAIL